MKIVYNEKNMTFNIKTENTSYVIGVLRNKVLLNLYYGKKVEDFGSLDIEKNLPTVVHDAHSGIDVDNEFSTAALSCEYPTYCSGADLRAPAFHAIQKNGSAVTRLVYDSHRIFCGKKPLSGLPSCYANNEAEAETLEITLKDDTAGISAVLSYTVFDGFDVLCRSVKIKNIGKEKIDIKSALSQSAYLFDKDYDFVHLSGSWARERHIERMPLTNAGVYVDSKRMTSGHVHSPFMALARPHTTEKNGEVYGFSLCYSGNFIARAEVDAYDCVRLDMGINPFNFNWELDAGEEFQVPEVISVYSDEGFGKMSRTYHSFYRTHLCRGKWRDSERPVLINNWEATYFDFDEDKILDIAAKAKKAGVELMVLDDGWFGKRDNDDCSLGDWVCDRRKLPNGIDGLAKKVKDLGMLFGLWFEPEMVSPDSDLYRAHPDWCIHSYDRERTQSRRQLILDLSREEVREYIIKAVSDVLSFAPISYVKWDMNRSGSEIGSAALPPEKQQELPHRYMLGLYEVLERITSAFPDVLFEGCSGGGGRFDAGMLPYFPQYWTSDDSDAIERLYIQYGTSMVMPSITMGAHVSAVPNHQVGRETPFKTRGDVAMSGQFGYELNLDAISDSDFEETKAQIAEYKQIREVVHKGDMYRLKSPFEGNECSWMYVNNDKSKAVLMYAQILAKANAPLCHVRLEGLDGSAMYKVDGYEDSLSGDYLMNMGLNFSLGKDFETKLIKIEKV